MREFNPIKTNLARGWHHGEARETVQACGSNSLDDTIFLARLQASRLVLAFGLLPDTAAAFACLIYGGV